MLPIPYITYFLLGSCKDTGKTYALYSINVYRTSSEGTKSWKVLRRYSDFDDLHLHLKEKVLACVKYFLTIVSHFPPLYSSLITTCAMMLAEGLILGFIITAVWFNLCSSSSWKKNVSQFGQEIS